MTTYLSTYLVVPATHQIIKEYRTSSSPSHYHLIILGFFTRGRSPTQDGTRLPEDDARPQ